MPKLPVKLTRNEIVVPPHVYQQYAERLEAMNKEGMLARSQGGVAAYRANGGAVSDPYSNYTRETDTGYVNLASIKEEHIEEASNPEKVRQIMEILGNLQAQGLKPSHSQYETMKTELYRLLSNSTWGTGVLPEDAQVTSDGEVEKLRVVVGSPQYRQLMEHPGYELFREVGQTAIFHSIPGELLKQEQLVHDRKVQTDPEYIKAEHAAGNISDVEAMERYSSITGVSKLKARSELGIDHPVSEGKGLIDVSEPLGAGGHSPGVGSTGQEATSGNWSSPEMVVDYFDRRLIQAPEAIRALQQDFGYSRLKTAKTLGLEGAITHKGSGKGLIDVSEPLGAGGHYSGVGGDDRGDLKGFEDSLGLTHGLDDELDTPEFIQDGKVVDLKTEDFKFSGEYNEQPQTPASNVAIGVQAVNGTTGEIWEAQ